MRILIHGINFSPELTGIGKYSGEMAEWLAAQGHEVRVVTAPPYYPQWKVADGFVNSWSKKQDQVARLKELVSVEVIDQNGQGEPRGFESCNISLAPAAFIVYRCPLWVPEKPSGLKRLLHLASFALSSFPVMLSQIVWRPDIVWVVEPALFCAPQAWLVARLSGAKTWLHIQDFEVDAAFELGILPPGFLRTFALWVERLLMRRFDRVSTISINMLNRLLDKRVMPSRCGLFPNWVDTNRIFPIIGLNGMRSALGIAPDKLVALYSGNMGEKQGLETVLEAAHILMNEQHIQFVLCGDGAARLRLIADDEIRPNVLWLPLQPMAQLNDLLNMADVHLLPQRAGAADLVMPSKLTGMLASGKPVLATALPGTQVAEVVRGCGVVTPPGDADAFAHALLYLANDADERQRLGNQARIYALAHLDKNRILERFEQMLRECLI
jgi:colanic acid biosynthesis glycosyl transferase WcaI